MDACLPGSEAIDGGTGLVDSDERPPAEAVRHRDRSRHRGEGRQQDDRPLPGELDHEDHGGEGRAQGGRQERGTRHEGEGSCRTARPQQAPASPQHGAQRGADCERGGEGAARSAAADRARGGDDLHERRDGEHPERQSARERHLPQRAAVAEDLGQDDREQPHDRERDGHDREDPPAARAMVAREVDELHETERRESQQRAGDRRPDEQGGADRELRDDVERYGRNPDPGHQGRDAGCRQGGEHGRDAQLGEEDLDGEHRPAERHVVDGGEPSAGSAGDQDAALASGQAGPVAEPSAHQRPEFAGSHLTTDRGAEADDHDLQRGVEHGGERRHPRAADAALDRDDRSPPPSQRPPAEGSDDARDAERDEAALRRRRQHAVEEGAGRIAVRHMLDSVQDQADEQAADAAADPDQDRDDDQPKNPGGAGMSVGRHPSMLAIGAGPIARRRCVVDLIYLCSNNSALHLTPDELRKLAAAESVEPAIPAKRRNWTRLNSAVKAEIIAAYKAGESSTSLAKRFGVSKTTILSALQASGTKLRNQPMTEADIAKARQRYEAGHALSELADTMPFSQEAIRKALISVGTKLRPARRV